MVIIIWTYKSELFYPIFRVFSFFSVRILFSCLTCSSQAHVYNKCKQVLNCLSNERHKQPVSRSPGRHISNSNKKKHLKDICRCGVLLSVVHERLSLSEGASQPKDPREEAVRKHWGWSKQALLTHSESKLAKPVSNASIFRRQEKVRSLLMMTTLQKYKIFSRCR